MEPEITPNMIISIADYRSAGSMVTIVTGKIPQREPPKDFAVSLYSSATKVGTDIPPPAIERAWNH